MSSNSESNFLTQAAKKIGVTGAVSVLLVGLGIWFGGEATVFGDAWPLVKLVLVFVFMVTLLRHKVEVGIVLTLSAVVLGMMFSLPGPRIGRVLIFDVLGGDASLHRLLFKAVVLTLVIFMINMLGRLMAEAGTLYRLIEALDDLVKDGRYVMSTIPAAIGLLPMPGGAMLSAPFVGELGDKLEMGPEDKTIINYWFRHIFEYAWPLYPGVIIAAELTNRPLSTVVLTHAPMILVAFGVGLVMLHLRFEPKTLDMGVSNSLGANALILIETIWPVATVAVVVGLAPYVATGKVKECLFPAALIAVNVAIIFIFKLSSAQVRDTLRKSFSWGTVMLVAGIYILRGMFEQTNVTSDMPTLLEQLGIPCVLIVFFVPFVVGVLTGYNVAAVSTAFPALVALLTSGGLVLVAYCGAFLGVLVSPVHLCLILTRDYFGADLAKIYKTLVPMLLVVVMALVGYTLLLDRVLRWPG